MVLFNRPVISCDLLHCYLFKKSRSFDCPIYRSLQISAPLPCISLTIGAGYFALRFCPATGSTLLCAHDIDLCSGFKGTSLTPSRNKSQQETGIHWKGVRIVTSLTFSPSQAAEWTFAVFVSSQMLLLLGGSSYTKRDSASF